MSLLNNYTHHQTPTPQQKYPAEAKTTPSIDNHDVSAELQIIVKFWQNVVESKIQEAGAASTSQTVVR